MWYFMLNDDVIVMIVCFTVIEPQSVEELKQHNSYLKLLKKQCKELKELRKKHLKKVQDLSILHHYSYIQLCIEDNFVCVTGLGFQ